MKKLLYVVGGLVGLAIIIALGAMTYVSIAFPKVSPAPDITIEATAERLARGEYLANSVSQCLECHSEKNNSFYAGPLIEDSEGKGGMEMLGVPGKVYASNITPAAIGDWSDGELLRAIVSGVSKDGRALAPMMPYSEFRHMSREDAYSIVAYIKTLAPIENEVPETKINFPLNFIFKTIPADAELGDRPAEGDTIAHGRYMARIAGCYFCHTPMEKGELLEGQIFSGNHEFVLDNDRVYSSNITPDPETGIGKWSRAEFIMRFKSFADSAGQHRPIAENGFQTIMGWTELAGMSESDLGAIYAYLQTVEPTTNAVVISAPLETE